MKKIIVIILGVLLTGVLANAQTFDLGVKGGYLYSSMDTKDIKSVDALKSKGKGGYLVGVFARLGGKIYFQPELQYRARTSDFELKDLVGSAVGTHGEIGVNYKTLDIPLQIGVNVLDLKVAKLSAHAGPVASLKLNADSDIKGAATNVENYLKDYKSFVWGAQVGVSVDVLKFVVDLSYEKGLSDLTESGVVGKNDLFMITVGVKLF